MTTTAENELLQRITVCPDIFGGKPIVRDMRIAVEHKVPARFVWKCTARRRQPPDFRLDLQAGLLRETAKDASHTGLGDAGIGGDCG